jgi:hypothetical protein
VAGGGERGAVVLEQVDARHLAADGEIGLARQRVEHGLQLERDVERVGGARERAVALGLGDAAALRLLAGKAERRLVGERLGDQDLVGRPDVGGAPGQHRDVADVAAPCDRHEQRAARLQAGRALGAELGGDPRLVERERARGGGDVRGAGDGRGRDELDGVDRQRAARLCRERGQQVGFRARGQGRLGEAAQRGMRGMRSGLGCGCQGDDSLRPNGPPGYRPPRNRA